MHINRLPWKRGINKSVKLLLKNGNRKQSQHQQHISAYVKCQSHWIITSNWRRNKQKGVERVPAATVAVVSSVLIAHLFFATLMYLAARYIQHNRLNRRNRKTQFLALLCTNIIIYIVLNSICRKHSHVIVIITHGWAHVLAFKTCTHIAHIWLHGAHHCL